MIILTVGLQEIQSKEPDWDEDVCSDLVNQVGQKIEQIGQLDDSQKTDVLMRAQRGGSVRWHILSTEQQIISFTYWESYWEGCTDVLSMSVGLKLVRDLGSNLEQLQKLKRSQVVDICYGLKNAGFVKCFVVQEATQDNPPVLSKVIQPTSFPSFAPYPPGGFSGPESNGYGNQTSAIEAPVTLNGQKAYGVFVSPGTGYRNNAANGTATADAAEGITNTGNGHMEAIYYGTCTSWGSGAGSGPWIMADLKNNLFSGASEGYNAGDPSISSRFVTTVVKGGANTRAIRGADAASSSSLSTYYSGARPSVSGYNPMSKEGAIILGIGGDNSNSAQGTLYEGVMTTSYPSDATENAVQANILAVKYATTSLTSGTALTVGSSISLRATTNGYTTRSGSTVNTQVVTSLGNSACFSFESVDTPGSYIRHYNFALVLNANDGTKQFYEDATFCPQSSLNGEGSSIGSWSYSTRYFRHYTNVLYAASNGGVHTFDATASFNDDVSWVISSGFA
ncbi:putative alpha-N-arabinofuranosidase B [Aspergillus cristatus]|uniref:Alpha-L-arabinofuranosidase n=1 Tax=Aspergillus cristatus TaxID=573508 RepID=A0A1E3B307_ASPCR|nr:putative alpha-N-arabinofuranosidase B [Aspergillus cristatus]